LILIPIEKIKKISKIDPFALKGWSFCIVRNKNFGKKNPENKICSQMYEVFDLNEGYERNKSHEIEQT
jgi:hypothetical protein